MLYPILKTSIPTVLLKSPSTPYSFHTCLICCEYSAKDLKSVTTDPNKGKAETENFFKKALKRLINFAPVGTLASAMMALFTYHHVKQKEAKDNEQRITKETNDNEQKIAHELLESWDDCFYSLLSMYETKQKNIFIAEFLDEKKPESEHRSKYRSITSRAVDEEQLINSIESYNRQEQSLNSKLAKLNFSTDQFLTISPNNATLKATLLDIKWRMSDESVRNDKNRLIELGNEIIITKRLIPQYELTYDSTIKSEIDKLQSDGDRSYRNFVPKTSLDEPSFPKDS